METSDSKQNKNPTVIKKNKRNLLTELLEIIYEKEEQDLILPNNDESAFTGSFKIIVDEDLLKKEKITLKVKLFDKTNQLIAECKVIFKENDPPIDK